MMIPLRDFIALTGVAVFFAVTLGLVVRMLIRKAYREGYDAGKAEAKTISAPGRHPVYLR